MEGIFRVSGSARTVEKVRVMFDKTSDADLNEISDVIAIASLLKLFLRELPEGAVSEDLTQQFIIAQQGGCCLGVGSGRGKGWDSVTLTTKS